MKIERFQYTEVSDPPVPYFSSYACKEFVYRHRNIFSDATKRYIAKRYYPVIIKEISKFKNEVNYWFWVFWKDHYTIYKFDHKPTRRELDKMWEMIRLELEEEKEKQTV